MKKVTIVMPVFNGERYLEESILSVLDQTYASIELIVIDGGSRDGTLEIIRKYESRLAYWISEPDKGMYDAINKGLKKATGDYIAYLNSDDLYFPQTVASVVEFFQAHPKTGMVFGDCEFIDAEGRLLHRYYYPAFRWRQFVSLSWMSIPQQTVFWTRDVLEKCGYFDSTYRMAGDFEFFARVGRQFRVSHIGGVTAKFRQHGESLSSKGVEMNKQEVRRLQAAAGLKRSVSGTLNRWAREVQIKFLNLPHMFKKALR